MHSATFDFDQDIQPLIFFSSRICHDLNNLITGGMGAAALLEHKCNQVQNAALLPEVERVNKTMDEFSSFTHKLEQLFWAGEGEKVTFDLARIVAAQAEQARTDAHPIIEDCDTIAFPLDGESLATAIDALIQNAKEAMPQGGDIHITLKKRLDSDGRHFAVLSLADQGCGIPEKDLNRIFQPFFSLIKRGNLVGLGLAFVGIVAHRHGGSLTVESEPGGGTRVTLRFPV